MVRLQRLLVSCTTLIPALALGVSVAAQSAASTPAQLQSHETVAPPGRATVGAATPDALGRVVMQRFASASAPAFDSVYPDPLGRAVVESAIQHKETRSIGLIRVLESTASRAVLLLTGTVHSGEGSGIETGSDETNEVRRFSGLYEAARGDGPWTITRQIPLDTLNFIRGQALHVALSPGHQSDILDSLAVTVGGPYGLAFRLNNAAHISLVQLDGRPAHYAFGGGVLWIDAPRSGASRLSKLVLRYTIADEHTPRAPAKGGKPAARRDTLVAYGALNNTDVWNPFFGYDSGNDFSLMSVTATIPARYRLTTSVPQTEVVRNGVRIVHGETMHPQFLLALIYDKDWQPVTKQIGELRVETFLTPSFRFSPDTLAAIVGRVYRVLVPRFGEPQLPSHYLAVVEDRALGHSGFAVRMNNAVISGDGATMLDEPSLGPSYAFAHEVSHGWTMNATGRAANFLQEGWASYCESLLLREVYGPATEHAMWEKLRTSYITGLDRAGFLGGFEGHQSILGRPDNGRIHYFKGSWILHQLEYVLGDSVFDRAMRAYIARSGSGSDGYEELIADMSRAAGRDMTSFIMPWLTEQYIPNVDARAEGQRLIVTQSQPGADFDLPLDIELITDSGAVQRHVHLTSRADTVELGATRAVSAVHVDPDHHFLLRRHWGELARFTLRAPNAQSVELSGSVASKPVAATRDGDLWSVTVPLTEGRYLWMWRVDGKGPTDEEALAAVKVTNDPSARAGVRIVRPEQRLADSLAR
jgi:hypothetical protein